MSAKENIPEGNHLLLRNLVFINEDLRLHLSCC